MDPNQPEPVSNLRIVEFEAPWRSSHVSSAEQSRRFRRSRDIPEEAANASRRSRVSGERQLGTPSGGHKKRRSSSRPKTEDNWTDTASPMGGARMKRKSGSRQNPTKKGRPASDDSTKLKGRYISRPHPVEEHPATIDNPVKRKSGSRSTRSSSTPASNPTAMLPREREWKRKFSSKPKYDPDSKREKRPQARLRTKLSVTHRDLGSRGGEFTPTAFEMDPRWIQTEEPPVPKARTKLTESPGGRDRVLSSAHQSNCASTVFLREAFHTSDRAAERGSGADCHPASVSPGLILPASIVTSTARVGAFSQESSSDLSLSERLWSPESGTCRTTPVWKAARVAPAPLIGQERRASRESFVSDASSKKRAFFSATEGTDRFSETAPLEQQSSLHVGGNTGLRKNPSSGPLDLHGKRTQNALESDCFFSASKDGFSKAAEPLTVRHNASPAFEKGQYFEKQRESSFLDDSRLIESAAVLKTSALSAEPSAPDCCHQRTGTHASSSNRDEFFSAVEKLSSDAGERKEAESELPFFSMNDSSAQQNASVLSTIGRACRNSSASGYDRFFSCETASVLPRQLSVIQEFQLSRETTEDAGTVKPMDVNTPVESHELHNSSTSDLRIIVTACNELESLLNVDTRAMVHASESHRLIDSEDGIVMKDDWKGSAARSDHREFDLRVGKADPAHAVSKRAFHVEGISSLSNASGSVDARKTPISGSDDPFFTASDMKGSLVEKSRANFTPELIKVKLYSAMLDRLREGSSAATEMLSPDLEYPFLTEKELRTYLGEPTRKLSSPGDDNFFTASGSAAKTEENRHSVSERKPFTQQGTERGTVGHSVLTREQSRSGVINRLNSFGDNIPVASSRSKSPKRGKEHASRHGRRTTNPDEGGLAIERGPLEAARREQRTEPAPLFRGASPSVYLYASINDLCGEQEPLDDHLLLQEDSWEPVDVVGAERPRLLAVRTTRAFASRLSDKDDERFLRALTRIPPFSSCRERPAPPSNLGTALDLPVSDTYVTAKSSVTKSASDPNFVAIKMPLLPPSRSRSDSVLVDAEEGDAVIVPPTEVTIVPRVVLRKSSAVPAATGLPKRAAKAKRPKKEVELKPAPARTNISSRGVERRSQLLTGLSPMEPAVSMAEGSHSKELMLGMMALSTTMFGLVLLVSALNSKSTAVRVLAIDQRPVHTRRSANFTDPATWIRGPITTLDNFVCSHERCIADGRYVGSSLSWDCDPCDDFYEFACRKWRKARAASALVDGGTSSSVQEDRERDLERRVAHLLVARRVEELEPLQRLHGACINANAINAAGWAPLGQLLGLCGLPDWPYVTPIKASPWRTAARALAMTNAEVFVSVAVTEHPTRHNRHIVALDRPRLILRPSDLQNDVHWLRDAAEAAMTAFRERPARLAAETVAFAKRLARLAFSRDSLSEVRLHRVSSLTRFPQLLQLLSTLFENVSAVHESSEVLLRSEGFVQDLLDAAEEALPRTLLNYVGLGVVVHSAAFLPDGVGLQSVHARVLLPHRFGAGFVARAQLCIRQVAETLPFLFLFAVRLLFGGSHTERALAILANGLRRQLLEQLPSLAFLDPLTRYRFSDILSSTRLHVVGPPLLFDSAAVQAHARALPSAGLDSPLLWFASTNAHLARIRLLRLSRYAWTGGVFDRDCSVDLQNNAVFVPPLFLNATAPLDRSLLFLQTPHLGVRLLRCLLVLLSAGVSNRGNRELLTRGWWSEISKGRLESLRRCLARQQSRDDESASTASLDQVADVAAVSPALALFQRDLAVVVARSSRQFRLPGAEDLSPAGLFFAYYALSRCRRGGPREPRAAAELVNAPLRNSAAFHAAFECRLGVRMNPEAKCSAWLK